MIKKISTFIFILIFISVFSQENEVLRINDSIKNIEIFDITIKPSKAAFYSAILPGLGQAYNKDYLKIPIIYSALGAGYYFYNFNNKTYKKYREAYKLLQLELPNNYPGVNASALESAQKYHKKYRDLSVLVTAGLYALQIVEASVDAHLQHHNTDANLTYKPILIRNQFNGEMVVGIGFFYDF